MVDRIESLSLVLLLPLFFALTGLRTRIDYLVSDKPMWGSAVAIIATAVVGKLAGAAFTAKASGMNWKDSFGLGVLMNTRGLVELVILNAGLDFGNFVTDSVHHDGPYGSDHNFYDQPDTKLHENPS